MKRLRDASQDRLTAWAFWGQVAANIVALLLVIVMLVQANQRFAKATVNQTRANNEIIKEVQREIIVHGEADASRTCAVTNMLVFIIEKGYQRAERLGSSGPEPAWMKHRLNVFERQACQFVDPTLTGVGLSFTATWIAE